MRTRNWVMLSAALLLAVIMVVGLAERLASGPEGAVRAYLIRRGGPAAAERARITPTGVGDRTWGRQFVVRGFRDPQSGREVRRLLVRRNRLGIWTVTPVDWGP